MHARCRVRGDVEILKARRGGEADRRVDARITHFVSLAAGPGRDVHALLEVAEDVARAVGTRDRSARSDRHQVRTGGNLAARERQRLIDRDVAVEGDAAGVADREVVESGGPGDRLVHRTGELDQARIRIEGRSSDARKVATDAQVATRLIAEREVARHRDVAADREDSDAGARAAEVHVERGTRIDSEAARNRVREVPAAVRIVQRGAVAELNIGRLARARRPFRSTAIGAARVVLKGRTGAIDR